MRARKDARTAYIRAAGERTTSSSRPRPRAAKERADAAAAPARRGASPPSKRSAIRADAVGRLDDGMPLLLLPLRLETRFKTIGGDAQGGRSGTSSGCGSIPTTARSTPSTMCSAPPRSTPRTRFWREYLARRRRRRRGPRGVEQPRRRLRRRPRRLDRAGLRAAQSRRQADQARRDRRRPGARRRRSAACRRRARRSPTYWTRRLEGRRRRRPADRRPATASSPRSADAAAADAAIAAHVPFNLADAPPPDRTRDTTNVTVAWLELPAETGEDRVGWRRAPTAAALPERFVLICLRRRRGPDRGDRRPDRRARSTSVPIPLAPEEDRIAPEDGKLKIPDPLKWMFDFDAAVAAGMGFRVPLTAEQAARGLRPHRRPRRPPARERRRRAARTFEELLRGHALQPRRLRDPRAGLADQQRRGRALRLFPPRRSGPRLRRRASARRSSS